MSFVCFLNWFSQILTHPLPKTSKRPCNETPLPNTPPPQFYPQTSPWKKPNKKPLVVCHNVLLHCDKQLCVTIMKSAKKCIRKRMKVCKFCDWSLSKNIACKYGDLTSLRIHVWKKIKRKSDAGGIRTLEPEGPEDSCYFRKVEHLESGAFDRTSLPSRCYKCKKIN